MSAEQKQKNPLENKENQKELKRNNCLNAFDGTWEMFCVAETREKLTAR